MCSNYSAQQYNDAYLPQRLGNWETPGDRDYEQRPRLHCRSLHQYPSPYFLVSDRHGRLLPTVKEQLLSRKEHEAWEQLSKLWFGGCDCILRRKNRRLRGQDDLGTTTDNPRFPIPSFFHRRKNKRPKQRPGTPKKVVDPYLLYLRELSIPTIWIMGVPTASIRKKRKQLSQEIADELDFAYLDLDDCIEKWTKRQGKEQMQMHGTTSDELLQNYNNISPVTIPNYRSLKPRKSISESVPTMSKEQTDTNPQHPRSHEDSSNSFPSPPINFSTSAPLTTPTVLDLLKFAMVEALPARGFVLDGFPCNLEEAEGFERHFYPASLALYFVTCGKQENGKEDALIFPSRFRRRFQFSHESGEIICARRNYGWKVIRILDTENVGKDTLSFLHQVVRDNLERQLNGQDKDGCVDVNVEEKVLTPRNPEQEVTMTTTDESQNSSPRGEPKRKPNDMTPPLPPHLLVGESSSSTNTYATITSASSSSVHLVVDLNKKTKSKGSENQTGVERLDNSVQIGGGAGDGPVGSTNVADQDYKSSLSSTSSTLIIFQRNDMDNTLEEQQLNSQIKTKPSPRKREDPDDRPLPLPTTLVATFDDVWWNSESDTAQRQKSPSTPPPSPCVNSSNQSLSPTEENSLELLSEWFEMNMPTDAKDKNCKAGSWNY